MEEMTSVTYEIYGEGSEWLFAFHGYGMDGNQYRIFSNSLAQSYKIVGFHLPYHRHGANDHAGWLTSVKRFIADFIKSHNIQQCAFSGYSIGAKITLELIQAFPEKVKKIILFAPFGIEKHWGLSFISKGFGQLFFRSLIQSNLPINIMSMTKKLGIIDQAHFEIIYNELDTEVKRRSLCRSLGMVGEITLDLNKLADLINRHEMELTCIYGQHDVIFPYHKRNEDFLNVIDNMITDVIAESHWLMTPQLDLYLKQKIV